ncbi:MAG: hypothetical protein KC503_34840, partial [Myxococcales bacterium]|nr:hypothetical protein [Myxococcales bacterium]
ANTAALYHFDEGQGDVIGDSSGAAGGPSDGVRRFGGTPAGPLWSSETPFFAPAADGAIDGPAPSRDGGARDAATDAVTDAARDARLDASAVDVSVAETSSRVDSRIDGGAAGDGRGTDGPDSDGCALSSHGAASSPSWLALLLLVALARYRAAKRRSKRRST